MPSVSKRQQAWAAGWEYNPEGMHGKPPDMTKKQLHDFAATKTKGLPMWKRKKSA